MKKNKIKWIYFTVVLTSGGLIALQLCYLLTIV